MLTRLSRVQKRAILLFTDASAVIPALWLAIHLRADQDAIPSAFWPVMIVAIPASLLISHGLRVADIRISAYEERAAGKSLCLSFLIGFVSWLTAPFLGLVMPTGLAVLFAACHFALSLCSRSAMARTLRWAYRRASPRRRVLIYGAGSVGLQALNALKTNPAMEPVGFVDDTPSLRGMMIGGVLVHPPVHLDQLVQRLRAEEVLIARPDLNPADRATLAERLEATGLRVASLPAFAHLAGPGIQALPGLDALDRPAPVPSAEAVEAYRDRVVVVTGAGGSIGSELAHQILKQKPRRLVLVENGEYALYQVDAALRPLADAAGVQIDVVLGSVCNATLMRRVLRAAGAEIVFHAAAYKHVPLVEANPAAALENNVLGTETMARVAAELGVRRFVLISTDKAVRPIGTMGLSKWIAEQVVRDLGRRHPAMQVAVVRFGNVLGSSGSVLPRFQQQVQSGGPVTITDPRMERYFMSIEEAVHLVLEAGAFGDHDKILFFDMGSPVRIEDLARHVIRAAGYTVRDSLCPHGDIALSFTGVRPGEKLSEELCLAGRVSPTSHPRIFAAGDPILSEFEVAQLLRDVRQSIESGSALDLSHPLPTRNGDELPLRKIGG